MPSQDNIKALYEELKNTYDVGSEDDFRNYLSDSNNREALRKELADDYEVGDSAAFSAYLGYDTPAPEKPQEKPVSSSGTPMSEEERKAMMNSTRDMMMGANQRARRTANQMQYATANSGLQVKPINLGQNNKVVEKEPTYNPETGKVESTYITESGNEYGTREEADLEQNAVERNRWINNHLDKINREQVASLAEDIDAQIEEHKQNNRSALAYGPYYGGAAGRNETNNLEWNTLIAAQRSMRDAQRMINEADYYANTDNWLDWLKEFGKGAARGFGEKLFDIDNWDMGLSDAHDAAAMRAALKAYDEGKELTRAQQSLLDAKAVELATQAYFGSYVGRGYKAGEVTAESIPFMIEMCLNPAAGTGKTLQSMMARYALKRFSKNATRFASKALARLTGDIAGSAAMAGSTGIAGVAADTMERMNGETDYKLDRNGQAVYAGQKKKKDAYTAATEALTARSIQNFSEMMGEYFAPVLGKTASAVANSKFGTKIRLDKVKDFVEKVSANDIAKIVTDFEKHAKWNGTIAEYFEEVGDNVLNATLVGDLNFKIRDKEGKLSFHEENSVFNLSDNIDTFLGVWLMGGVLSAAKTVGYRTPKYRARQDMKNADNLAAQIFGNQDTWGEIRNTIAFGNDEDVKNKLAEVKKNPELTQAQKAAVFKYAGTAEKYRGILIGEEKRRAEADPVQVDAETSFDNGYSLETPQELNDAKNNLDYQRKRAEDRFGEIKGLDDYPVQTIQTMQQQGYSPEDIQLALDYVNAKATYDGMQQRVADDVEGQVSIANSTIDRRTNRDTGMVHPITLNNDHKGYVVGGELVMSDNGIDAAATKQANNDNMIFIADEEGKIQAISVDDIASADAPIDAAQEKAQAEQNIRQTYTQQAEDKMNGVLPFNNGDTYNVVDEEGQQHQVQVVETLAVEQQGALVPSQTDVIVSVDGGQPVQMPKQQVQDMYNAASLARLQQHEEEKQKAEEQAQKFPVGEQNVPKEGINGSQGGNNSEKPTYSYNDEVTLQTEQAAESDAMPMIGEGEDAEPDFSKATPERAYAYIYKEADLSPEEADQFIEANKKAADKELSKTQDKKKPVMGTSIAAYKKAMNEWQQAVGAAQERADYWKQIQDMRKAESPATEVAPAAPVVTPENVEEKVLTVKQNKPARVDSNTKAWQEAKGKYGEYLNDDIDTPNDIMELVAMNMPSNINWEGRDGKRGLQAELGLKRGIGKKYSTNAFNSYLAKKGEGQSFDEAVHSIWESDNNLLPNGEHRFDDTDIRNALLDMFMNASKPSDITNYVLNNRVRMAEEALRAEQDRQEEYEEMQRMQQESMEKYGMTVEEHDYLLQYFEEQAPIREEYENSQEYLDNIEKNSNFAGDGRERKESTGGIPSEGAGEVETGISSRGESLSEVQGQTGNETGVPEDTAGGTVEATGRTEAGTRIVREYVKNILDQAGVDVSLADRMSDDEVHELNGLIADWEKVNDRYGRVVEEQDKNLKSKDKAVRDAAQKKIDAAQEKANEAFEPVERYIRDLQLNELSDKELVKFVADKEANAENEDALYDDADYVAALDIMEERDLGERAGETSNTSSPEEIAAEEAKVNTQPTEGQKEAGNYQKGHIKIDGFDVTIENPKGSVRSGVDADGKEWSQTMNNTYGYIRGTEGVDGDHIDVFLSENPEQGSVFVVDQVNPKTGEFDEHKVMYGFASAEEAKQAYLANYEEGWQGLGVVTEVSKEEFKKWIESSHRKTKPFSEYKSVKPIGAQNEGTEKPYTSFEELVADTDITVKDPARKQAMRQFVDKIFKHGSSNTRRERGVEYRFVYLTDATNKADRKMLEPWYSSKKIEYNDNNPTATWVDEGEQRIYFVKYQPKGVGVGDWDMTIAGYKQIEKPVGETAGTETTKPQDANLIPRDAEEEKIVADVTRKLQEDIDAAIKARNKAASDLQKARAKESDRATDLFGNDNAFNQEGQLFDNSEMPVDQSAEGVSRRTQTEQEAFNEATANLAKLQSPQERNSRIRGALDNHRNQTSMQYAEGEEQKEKGYKVGDQFKVIDEDGNYHLVKIKYFNKYGNIVVVTEENKTPTLSPKQLNEYRERYENSEKVTSVQGFISNTVDDEDDTFVEKLSSKELDKLYKMIDVEEQDRDWDALYDYIKQMREKYPVEKSAEPQPIGRGAFGNIYDQFKGKVKEAFAFLQKHKSGDLLSVFHRDDIGDIDLVWGSAEKEMGLEHIIVKHVGKGKDFENIDDAISHIEDVITNGTIIQNGNLRYVVSEDGYRVAIRKDFDGVKKNWIVTAVDYNRSKEEKGITTNPTSASHGAKGSELAAPNNSFSEGKGTEKNSSVQEKGEKNATFSVKKTTYTNKKGKTTPMFLVSVDRELSTEELRAGKALAKESRGWWDSKQGGFMMRDEDSVKQLVESLSNEEAVADAQPLSLSDMAAQQTEQGVAITSQQTEPQQEATPSYGGENKLVSRDRYEELKERMRKKLGGQMNMGIDPEILAIGVEMAAYHIEAGARKFADFAKRMVEELGDAIRPYLKAFYNGARELPEVEEAGYSNDMTPYDEVRVFDVANFDKPTTDAFATAEQVIAEQEVAQQAEVAKEKITEQRNDGRVAQSEGVALDGTPLRPATEADLDDRNNAEFYHNGKRVYVMAVMRSGEQISATQFSEPVIESIYLTNGKSVKLEELTTPDSKKEPISQKEVEKVVEKARKKNSSTEKSVSLQRDLFADVEQNDNDNEANGTGEETDNDSQRESARLGSNGTRPDGRQSARNAENTTEGRNAGREADADRGTNERPQGRPVEAGVSEHGSERGSEAAASGNVQSGTVHVIQDNTVENGSTRTDNHSPLTPKEKNTPKNTRNYLYPADAGEIDNYTPSERMRTNVEALEVLRTLIREGRDATPAERATMGKLRGWGGVNVPNEYEAKYEKWKLSADQKKLLEIIEELDPSGELMLLESLRTASHTSYYTPIQIAKAMHSVAEMAGYKGGGAMLDPSMGNGVFEGTMKKGIQQSTQIRGVELDWLTGQIAMRIYPDAKIDVTGLQDAHIPQNRYDYVVSNIPFGSLQVTDLEWERNPQPIRKTAQKRIHNYFTVKMIESTRPGGLCVIMTSNAVMDTNGNAPIRKYIADNCEILGAIRLPNNTFKGAGTSVVTDIIFLRKFKDEADRNAVNGNEEYNKEIRDPFLEPKGVKMNDRNGYTREVVFSSYYQKNAKNVIGDAFAGGQYSDEAYDLGSEFTTDQLADKINKIGKRFIEKRKSRFGDVIYDTTIPVNQVVEAVKESYKGNGNYESSGNIVIQDGKTGKLEAVKEGNSKRLVFSEKKFGSATRKQIEDYITLRTLLKQLIAAQIEGRDEAFISDVRSKMQQAYQTYTARYGKLLDKKNSFIDDDIDGFQVRALEKWEKGKLVGMADIYTKNTISSAIDMNDVKDPQAAVLNSLAEYGYINNDYLESVFGENWPEVCGDLIFEDPEREGTYVSKDIYLTGDVVSKLEYARLMAAENGKWKRNVEALEKVQPRRKEFGEFPCHMGARWVPVKIYNDFLYDLFDISRGYRGGKSGIDYIEATCEYIINLKEDEFGGKASQYRTKKKKASEIFEAALLDKDITIRIKDENGKDLGVDKEATDAARDKVQEIRDAFEDWVVGSQERIKELTDTYNATFNRFVLPTYNGQHLNVVGLQGIKLRPHQKDAIWRIINQRGGIIDHIVGAGKSLVMMSSVMEMRRMGIAKKPMIIALKATTAQIAKEFREAFPSARVLAPSEKDFSMANRKKFLAQIAVNDYDCIILSHEQYSALDHEDSIKRSFIQEQIDQLDNLLEYLYGQKEVSQLSKKQIKGLEKRRDNLREKLKKLELIKTDQEFVFENLGVDYLFVDECQAFKNLMFQTSYDRVAGLGNPAGSERSTKLLYGIRALQEMHQGDMGTIFLSGTTISNSLSELYNLFNYLRPNEMRRMGLNTFDAWASTFAVRSSEAEFGVTNELKEKSRFRKFEGLQELSRLYTEITDVRNDSNLELPKPKIVTRFVAIPISSTMEEINNAIVEMVRNHDGSYFGIYPEDEDKYPWSLAATNLAKKATLSPKLIDEKFDDEEGKIFHVCENVAKIYKKFDAQKGVQLIFCDSGVPDPKKPYDAYTDIITRLTEQYGIPRSEIVDIHVADTDEKRRELFKRVNNGEVRILIGGTKNMGTGVNVQKRVVAMHHLDIPWTPADVAQRNGRGARQGNEVAREHNNNEVEAYYYAVEKTLDTYRYQLQEVKGKMIDSFKTANVGLDEFDEGGDAGEEGGAMNPAEMVAILSGNPVILDKAKQDKLVDRLNRLKRSSLMEYTRRKQDFEMLQTRKRNIESLIKENEEDIKILTDNGFVPNEKGEYPPLVVTITPNAYATEGTTYDKASKAGKAILDEVKKTGTCYLYSHGVKAKVVIDTSRSDLFKGKEVKITNLSGIEYIVALSDDDVAAGQCMQNLLKKVYKHREAYRKLLDEIEHQLEGADPGEYVFTKQKELEDAIQRKREIDKEYDKLIAADKGQINQESTSEEDSDVLYRLREDAAPKNTGIGYKLFVLKDGKLYPPMVANPNGAPTPVGIWLDADAAPIVGTTKTGRPQVKAGGKGTQGGSGQLAYRPGWHLGTIPYALQFNRKDASGEKTLFPANFVWAEVEYANDVDYQEEANKEGINANGKYQHSLAGLKRVPKDGSYTYRTNPNPETDPWVITGAMKVKRLLKPSEVDELVKAAGRKPQQRQDGYVSDAEIDAMNAKIDELEREGDGSVDNATYGTYEESLAASRAAGYTKKQHDAYQRRLRTRIRQAAEDVIAKLNLTGKVTLLENGESLQGRKARAKGFFNPDTGDIIIVLGNHRNVEDVVKTVLHECVAHYGLRQLFGKNFDNFLYNVLSSATPEIREQITEQARQLNWDFDTAIEEYLARLAEDTDFERTMDRGWWMKIKEAFLNMLDKLGLRGYFKGELSDNELRYILWRSYQNLSEPDRYRNPFNVAEDVAMQYKLNVGNYSHNDVTYGNRTKEEEGEEEQEKKQAAEAKAKVVRMGHIEDFLPEIKNRKDEETIEDYVSKMSAAEAKAAYKRINAQMLDEDGLNLDEHFEKTKREWIDKHGLKGVGKQQADELQKAIDKYGAKMVELRWNLMDRLIELDEFDTSLFRDGDDVAEHVNSIPRRYGLRGGAPFLVVNGKKELDWLRDTVSPEAFALVMKAYNRPNVTGTHIFPANFAIVFGEKVSSPEEAGITWWHEQTHSFFDSLPQDKQKEYGDFFLNYMHKNYPEDYETIINEYKEPDWGSEACAYFAENIIKEQGADNFMTANFVGDEEISTFANELREYLRNGKEGKTNNRPEQGADKSDASRHGNSRGRNDQPQGRERRTAEGEESPRASYRISSDGTQEAYNRAVNTGKKGTLRTTGYNFREAFQDSMLSVKKLQEVVEKKYGIKLPQSEDAYKHENALSSTNMQEVKRFIEGIAEDMLKAADKLLLKGSSKEDLRDYLIAKHGLERNVVFAERDFEKYKKEHPDGEKTIDDFRERDYSGLTALTGEADVAAAEAAARQIVDDYESKYGSLCDDLWDAINKVTKATLTKSWQCSMMSNETHNKVRNMFKYYVPLRGFDADTAEDLYDYHMGDRGAFNGTLKTAKGRTSLADDPLAEIVSIGESAILQGNRNMVKRNLYNMAVNHPTDVCQLRDMWIVEDAQGEWEANFPQIPDGATDAEVSQILADHEQAMEELEQQGKAKRVRNNLDIGYRIDKRNIPDHAVVVYINGKQQVIYINGNPRAAQALNGRTGEDVESRNAIRKLVDFLLKDTKRFYSSMLTQFKPTFAVANFVRDLPHAIAMTYVNKGAWEMAKYLGNLVITAPFLIKNQLKIGGKSKYDRYFAEFVKNGGITGYAHLNDVEEWKHRNDRRWARLTALQKGYVAPAKAFGVFMDAIGWLSETLELIPRYNTYVAEREEGADIPTAIKAAKDITVNFNKKGSEMTQGVWGAVANTLRYEKMFFNPIMQGLNQFYEAGKNHPVRFAIATLHLPILGTLVPYVNEMLVEAVVGGGGGDDDEKKRLRELYSYWNLNPYTRRNNICIFIGNGYFKLPIAPGFRELYGMGEVIATHHCGKCSDMEMVVDLVNQLRTIFSVEGQTAYQEWSVSRFLLPEHLAPFIDIENNENFTGSPLWYENQYKEHEPEYKKAKRGTWSPLIEASKDINKWLGGTDNIAADGSGKWLNPAAWQHIISNYGGGIVELAGDIISVASDKEEGKESDSSQWPIAKRFYQKSTDERAQWAMRKKYQEYLGDYELASESLSESRKQMFPDGDYSKTKEFVEHNPEVLDTLSQTHPRAAKIYEAWQEAFDGDIDYQLKKLRREGEDEEYWEMLREAVEIADSVTTEKKQEKK